VGLPYGFKTKANALARRARVSLDLATTAPLSPWQLAEKLKILVVPLSSFAAECGDAVRHFMRFDRRAFSAGTFTLAGKSLIVFNDANAADRQASDVAHELAHIILEHPFLPILDERGCRHLDRDLEDQANWLGPALLVSEEAALEIARQGWSVQRAALEYRVTEDVVRFRLNVTAAFRRVA
jgi:Zn-dependent peptidase ImmA (M78 family)